MGGQNKNNIISSFARTKNKDGGTSSQDFWDDAHCPALVMSDTVSDHCYNLVPKRVLSVPYKLQQ